MKRQFTAICITSFAFFAASCEEDLNKGTVWEDPAFIRLVAETEKITEQSSEVAIKWIEGEAMTVFDETGNKAVLTTNDPSTNVFFSKSWTEGTPTYAVYPAAEGLTCSAAGVLGGVNISSEQAGAAMQTVSVGKVTGNRTAYKINPMMNVVGMLRISLSEASASKITIESVGGEPIAGTAGIDYSKLENGDADFWSVTEASTSIDVVPASDGDSAALLVPGTYYVTLLPQTYSQGLRITAFLPDGEQLVRVVGGTDGFTVPRSNSIVEGKGLDDTLPEEIVISLNFHNESKQWPFTTAFVSTDMQSAEGDNYVYSYTYDYGGAQLTKDLDFIICKGADAGASYSHKTFPQITDGRNVFFFSGTNAWIKLPGIPGRYLKEVSMSHGNKDMKKRFRIQETTASEAASAGKTYSSPLVTGTDYTVPVTSTITFPTTDTTYGNLSATTAGTSYVMLFSTGGAWTGKNMRVFDITLKYTTTLE